MRFGSKRIAAQLGGRETSPSSKLRLGFLLTAVGIVVSSAMVAPPAFATTVTTTYENVSTDECLGASDDLTHAAEIPVNVTQTVETCDYGDGVIATAWVATPKNNGSGNVIGAVVTNIGTFTGTELLFKLHLSEEPNVNRCWSVSGGSLLLATCNQNDVNQLFISLSFGKNLAFVSVANNKCVHDNGSGIDVITCFDRLNQRWFPF